MMKASVLLSILISLIGSLSGKVFAFQLLSSSPLSSIGRHCRKSKDDSTSVLSPSGHPRQRAKISMSASILEDITTSSSSSSTSSSSSFENFDYTSHWYPVIWAQDVPLNQPIRVTLFDVDYVLAKTTAKTKKSNDSGTNMEDEEVFYAMLDSCPHKKVALSEGRITDCGTSDKKYFQCSYHGWTFDGESGQCMEIPQTLIASHEKGVEYKQSNTITTTNVNNNNNKQKSRREDATAVATHMQNGMVYIHPMYTPLEALAAMNEGTLDLPPTIPEMNMEGYKTNCVIRDFPIDWTVLIENIMDPDHGYFAHAATKNAAKGFDWYCADGVENTVRLDEDFSDGGWKVRSSVNAVEKLMEYNREVRTECNDDETDGESKPTNTKKKGKNDKEEPPKLATTTFVAPSLIYLGRRTNSTEPSSFLTAFWVCPTGTGKSRFMSAGIGKLALPRWLMHIQLNNFLDQDTYLLCGQHRAVLKKEAEGYLKDEEEGGKAEKEKQSPNNVRKSTYVYRSPSERLPVRLGQFFDATLARVPNRKEGLLTWYKQNAKNDKLFESWPSREVVLDRYEQHTKVCLDSMSLVEKCDAVIKSSKIVGLAMIFIKLIVRSSVAASALTSTSVGGISNPFVAGTSILSATRQLLSQSTSIMCGLANSITTTLLRGKMFYSILALSFLSYSIATRIKKEFFFKFDEKLHRDDIKFIPKNWVDL